MKKQYPYRPFVAVVKHKLLRGFAVFAGCCGLVSVPASTLFWSEASLLHGAERHIIGYDGLFVAKNKTTEQVTAEEEKIQAAFIRQFLQFIEFPPSTHSRETFVVGFIGFTRVEGFAGDIMRQKRTTDGRIIEVRHINELDEIANCRVLFVSPTENGRLQQILDRTRGKSILTLGRDETFLDRGGLINFYVENSRVRFEYNTEEITVSKLRFSSNLLRLGRQYTKK